jgi:hypothetical protein
VCAAAAAAAATQVILDAVAERSGALVELPSSRVGGRSAVMVRGLPAGWEKKTDSTGRAFYVDNHNERTSWDPPVGYDGDVFVSK